jgi:sugar lactone lactonase YvrE
VLNSPNGIAVDPNTQFQYVANTGNNNVQMYSPRGNFIQFWGQAGGGTYDFRLPYGVAVNPVNDHVYVADSGNNRVQVFSYLGFYVSTISVPTSASYAFSAPRNLAFDPSGNLYVGDITGHVFQFNSSGTYVAEWGGNGLSTAGGFQFGVGGMAVTPTGTLFAADPANNRVQGFTSIQQQALIANSSSSVAGGWAAPRVHCRRGTGACRGFVRLFHRGAWAGTHSFALRARQTRTVRVHLNRRARLALARGLPATALAVVQTRQSSRRLVRTQGRVFRLGPPT